MSMQKSNLWLKLFALIHKDKFLYAVSIIFKSAGEAGLYIAVGLVIRNVVNAAVNNSRDSLIQALWIAFLQTFLCALVMFSAHFLYNRVVHHSIGHIKMSLFQRVLQFPEDTLKNKHSGEVLSRVINDVGVIHRVFTSSLYSLIYALVFGLGSLTVMLILNWRYALVFSFFGVILSWLNSRMSQGVHATASRLQQHMGKMTEKMTDTINGASTIKMYQMKKWMVREYSENNRMATSAALDNNFRYALLDSTNYIFSWIVQVSLIVIGCLLLLDGKSQLGELLAIGQLLYGVNFMLNNIGRFMMDFKASEPAVDRVLELMEERTEKSGTEVADGTGSLHQTVNEKSGIKLDDVVFTHRNGNKVLDQASLSVEQGELVALIGPSGEGKSTVIKLLMGFYEPLKGDISVAGQRLAQSDLELWRSNIAYVPQNSFLFEGSIAENIRFGKPEASDEEIAAAAESACAHEFIMELPEGYDTIISENSTNLSGGQRQRIALARAFIKKAPVLLLDEATSALDFETEKRIIQSLNKLKGKQTVLMISHRPTAYTGFSHVFTLRQGKLERL